MMDPYHRPCVCSCGRCDDKVGEVLRIERSLCTGAKMELTRRRKRIAKQAVSDYGRRRYKEKKRRMLAESLGKAAPPQVDKRRGPRPKKVREPVEQQVAA